MTLFVFSFSLHIPTVLQSGVTDDGLCALASAGCGENLILLTLECELVLSLLSCVLGGFFPNTLLFFANANEQV